MLMLGALVGVAPSRADAAELINATNSTLAWSFSGSPNAVDATPSRYNDCPARYPKTYIFACETEFFYQRPNGTDGTRWFFVSGDVQWTGVHVNPYGPGELGTPQSSSYPGSSWVRHWHRESPNCLRSWRIHGDIQSNFPCAAYQIWHGTTTEGFGDGDLTWSWLYDYRCDHRGAWTLCRNALGDGYRYRGTYPSVWGSRSGARRGETARACYNHAGRLEGDGQYSGRRDPVCRGAQLCPRAGGRETSISEPCWRRAEGVRERLRVWGLQVLRQVVWPGRPHRLRSRRSPV